MVTPSPQAGPKMVCYRGVEALRLSNSRCATRIWGREREINVNGGGQECPPHRSFVLT
jgi:hypothetical protein